MKLNLPKSVLSYSAIDLWNKNKAVFRKRYYENIKFPDTKYQIFGHEIEKQIYEGKHPEIPFGNIGQHKLVTEYRNIPLLGYLDSFDIKNKQFIDYKTSLSPWTEADVFTLDQLPFYNFLIKKIYGKAHPICKLVWMETQLMNPKGLLTKGDYLIYTGKFKIFERKIFEWERKRIKEWIYRSAQEISNDYTAYQKSLPKA